MNRAAIEAKIHQRQRERPPSHWRWDRPNAASRAAGQAWLVACAAISSCSPPGACPPTAPSVRSDQLVQSSDMTTGTSEKQVSIEVLHETSSSIEKVAQWLSDEWGREQDYSFQDTLSWCRNVASMKNELIFCANWAARPVGVAFMVDCDLPSHRHFSPWLSSLFVVPEYRRHGIGSSLVERLCSAARERGHAEVYLHALEGPLIPFYHRSGWSSIEKVELARREFVVMRKTLQLTAG